MPATFEVSSTILIRSLYIEDLNKSKLDYTQNAEFVVLLSNRSGC